jgi:polysaccharide export outer membrane protein
VRLDDLIKDGDISANVRMQPGDVLVIPESYF